MSTAHYSRLEDVILDDAFPDLDIALRRGRHVDRDDSTWYTFLSDAAQHLETFYRRFGCELVHKNDGYYYLLPTSDRLGQRQLSAAEMLVGQALTLLYLDPNTVQQGGSVTREQLLSQLASVMGPDSLIRALNPKRRRYDERVAEENVRLKVAEALRRLAALGFVEMVEDAQIRLRPALMRFAEPVRGVAAPEVALERLVAEGELAFSDVDEESEPEQEPEPERAVDQASADAIANLWDGFEEPGAATHSTDEPPEPE